MSSQRDTENSLTTPSPTPVRSADLVVEPEVDNDAAKDSFARQLEATLKETEEAVSSLSAIANDALQARSWENASKIVKQFSPVPWFIWRLSNYVLGKPGQVNECTEGLVFGMRRLLFAAASDALLGSGQKVNNVRKALGILSGDVVASCVVIHAICRKLSARPFERIWRPILDDAVLRAKIGYSVGRRLPEFGPGRGMLAGFAGRSGLAVLISSGELEQARLTLEKLATGAQIKQVGLNIYRTDPLQVSAMMLSAAGCGRDAAFGTVSYAAEDSLRIIENEEQKRWLAAFSVCESVRIGEVDKVKQEYWETLHFTSDAQKLSLADEAKQLSRRGHGWSWLI